MPSLSGLLQRRKYFVILDKDQKHPKKKYFDFVCFKLIKDNQFYHEMRYIDKPFFTGLVLFDKDSETGNFVPFKLWKRRIRSKNKENQLKYMDPTSFRLFLINADFIVIGNHLNKPQGHQFEKFQVIEKNEAHTIQKNKMEEYLEDLQPIYDYCELIQYKSIRNYLFCHSCIQEKKFTLIDETNRYKNQAFFVCQKCAGKEIIRNLKKRTEVTSALKIYLRNLLKKYKNVIQVLNVFNPNFNVLEHKEATLVGIKKKKISVKSTKKSQSLYDFDLPEPLMLYFQKKKRIKLLPAQSMALEQGLLENQSELIVSSTSSGKTMIGEICGFSKILDDKIKYLAKQGIKNPFSSDDELFNKKIDPNLNKEQRKYLQKLKNTRTKTKMLYVVPIVALASMRNREYKELKSYGINSALKIGVSHISERKRSVSEFGVFQSADVIIATYEAIDILLRSGHPYLLRDIRTVVVDEIQMLADEERGFVLDGLIARLRLYLPNNQMLYLSATISDPKGLAKHYRAALVHYKDRPVPLERHLVMCMDDNAKKRNLIVLVRAEFRNKSSFGFRGQTIIFTNSRKNTEKLAEYLRKNHIRAHAYHGGLDYSQRKYIEKSFEMQKTACVVTTAALAAGVDFPASMVIFSSLIMGIQELTVAEFEQMSGRAGRLKKHDMGKVYLLVTPGKSPSATGRETEEQLAIRLLKGDIEPLELAPNEGRMYSEILAVISMYSPRTQNNEGINRDNLNYFHSLLFNGNFDLQQALIFFRSEKFIKTIKNNSKLRTTRFGKACAESFLTLEHCIKIKKILLKPITEEDPAPDMLLLAQSLYEFNNVYVSNWMLSELSLKNQNRVKSNNFFSSSVLSMINAEHMGKKRKTRISRKVFQIIIRWSEDIFNCICKESPFCDCGKRNVEGYIFDYRLSGLTISEITHMLKDEYEIKVFFGDIVNYLESIIYSLLSIQKIGKSLPIPAQTMLKVKKIHVLVNKLIGHKRKSKSKN